MICRPGRTNQSEPDEVDRPFELQERKHASNMIEDVEPCPLLDDRKERNDRDAGHDELRDRDDAGRRS